MVTETEREQLALAALNQLGRIQEHCEKSLSASMCDVYPCEDTGRYWWRFNRLLDRLRQVSI